MFCTEFCPLWKHEFWKTPKFLYKLGQTTIDNQSSQGVNEIYEIVHDDDSDARRSHQKAANMLKQRLHTRLNDKTEKEKNELVTALLVQKGQSMVTSLRKTLLKLQRFCAII